MPIYEYRCKQCEAEFEKYVPGATTAVACPTCASEQVMRKLSVFGLKTVGALPSGMPSGTSGGGCCGGGCACH
jgi:putative FmdB family regulatory protein